MKDLKGRDTMKISMVTGYMDKKLGFEKCYESIAEAGFTAVDWSIYNTVNTRKPGYAGTCIFEKPLDAVIAHYSEELASIRKNGLTITQAHAPWPLYLPGQPELTAYAIGILTRMIELCGYAGCPRLVIHPICLSLTELTDTPEDIDRINMHMLGSLIPTLIRCNVTACLENLYVRNDMNFVDGAFSDPYGAAAMVDRLNEKAGQEVFGICLDTGHMNLLGKDMRTFLPVLGKRIKALHINDNDGFSDQHIAPLAGKINWKLFCQCLRQIGYEGDLSFETTGQSKLVLEYDEELLLPWLSLICKTGESFRQRIRGE